MGTSVAALLVLLFTCSQFESSDCFGDGTVYHFTKEPTEVTLNIQYSPTCSSKQNTSIGIILLPTQSVILNVLEHACFQHPPSIFEFELVYLHNLGYFVLSIDSVATAVECSWGFTTNPPVSEDPLLPGLSAMSVDDVCVSNYGMEVTFSYFSHSAYPTFVPVIDLLSGRVQWPWPWLSEKSIPSLIIVNPVPVDYTLEYPEPMCQPSSAPIGSIFVNISSGQSALNVIEAGAIANVNRSFTVHNFYGLFYSIRSINVVSQTSSCQWCVLYSPDGVVPSYFITAAPNDFVIPVSGGTLTLQYRQSCNPQQNNLNKGNITKDLWLSSRKAQKWYKGKAHVHQKTEKKVESGSWTHSLLGLSQVAAVVVAVGAAAFVFADRLQKHSKQQ